MNSSRVDASGVASAPATTAPASTASAEVATPASENYSFREMLREVPPLVITGLVLAIVGMNLLANKSVNTGLSWLALDCGFLLSWMCFLAMDILTRCFGPKAATQMSLVALVLNFIMAIIFFLGSIIPGEWSTIDGVNDAIINGALDATFRGTWFIILGSSIAFATSSVVNNYLNSWIGKHLRSNKGFGAFIARSSVSTLIAQIVDNLVFAFIVSKTFFGWTLTQCITCALAGALIELLSEVIFTPVGYRVSTRILEDRARSKAKLTGESE